MPRKTEDINAWWDNQDKAEEAERLVREREQANRFRRLAEERIAAIHRRMLADAQARHDRDNEARLRQERADRRKSNRSQDKTSKKKD